MNVIRGGEGVEGDWIYNNRYSFFFKFPNIDSYPIQVKYLGLAVRGSAHSVLKMFNTVFGSVCFIDA